MNIAAKNIIEVEKPKKKERTIEETAALKREFQLNFNSYTVGSYKDIVLDKLHNHIFQGDGDYLIVNNKIGKFIVKMNDAKRPGLPEEFKGNKIQLKVPKIPKKIYYQILAFFQDIASTMGNSEAFIQVYFDKTINKYVCNVPEQTVSGASVLYDATKNLNELDRSRYVFVFEIHSHNSMSAFWSGTDNADEKETKFYGVFGKVNEEKHEEKFRFMVMGKQIDVNKEHIFDFSDEEISKQNILDFLDRNNKDTISKEDLVSTFFGITDTYPLIWKDNIKKPTYNNASYIGGKPQTDIWANERNDWNEEKDPWHPSHSYSDREERASFPENKNSGSIDELIEIEETFNLSYFDDETKPLIIEAFASSMTESDASVMLEALVDQGFDPVIQYFKR